MKLACTLTNVSFIALVATAASFAPCAFRDNRHRYAYDLNAAKIGIFYGTSTGSTGEVADLIADAFGDVATEPIEVEEVTGEVGVHFSKYEALIGYSHLEYWCRLRTQWYRLGRNLLR